MQLAENYFLALWVGAPQINQMIQAQRKTEDGSDCAQSINHWEDDGGSVSNTTDSELPVMRVGNPKPAQEHLPMPVVFEIEIQMYGANIISENPNSIVSSGPTQDWHPGRWVDPKHGEIKIGFDCLADAQLAGSMRGGWGA